MVDGKNGLWGSAFCPQADDVCDSASTKGFGTKKLKTFASASDAAVTVKLSDKLDDTSSCSYFIEATCDAPYVEYKASPGSWPTAGAALTYTVAEWSGVVAKMTSAEAKVFIPAAVTGVTGLTVSTEATL